MVRLAVARHCMEARKKMAAPDRKPLLASLGANLALFLLLPLALNGVIFGLGWNRSSAVLPGLPPGWLVGAIWMALFAAMGLARWLMLRGSRDRAHRLAATGVGLLGFLCLLYPLYTIGLSNDRAGLVGNIITLVVALAAAVLAWRRSRAAGACVVMVCLWLSYAAAVTANGLVRGLTR